MLKIEGLELLLIRLAAITGTVPGTMPTALDTGHLFEFIVGYRADHYCVGVIADSNSRILIWSDQYFTDTQGMALEYAAIECGYECDISSEILEYR